jgi:hypothetical protein
MRARRVRQDVVHLNALNGGASTLTVAVAISIMRARRITPPANDGPGGGSKSGWYGSNCTGLALSGERKGGRMRLKPTAIWGMSVLPGRVPEKLYRSIDGLQADPMFGSASTMRPHQGRRCLGKMPMQAVLDALPMTKEKMIAV